MKPIINNYNHVADVNKRSKHTFPNLLSHLIVLLTKSLLNTEIYDQYYIGKITVPLYPFLS